MMRRRIYRRIEETRLFSHYTLLSSLNHGLTSTRAKSHAVLMASGEAHQSQPVPACWHPLVVNPSARPSTSGMPAKPPGHEHTFHSNKLDSSKAPARYHNTSETAWAHLGTASPPHIPPLHTEQCASGTAGKTHLIKQQCANLQCSCFLPDNL